MTESVNVMADGCVWKGVSNLPMQEMNQMKSQQRGTEIEIDGGEIWIWKSVDGMSERGHEA